jgi:NAD(P)H-quinone oxidoreductase subunit 5
MTIRQKLLAAVGSSPMKPVFGPGAMNVKELDHEAEEHDNHGHGDDHGHGHSHSPHESPLTMTLPLLILAIPSTVIGLLGKPWDNTFEQFIYAPGEVIEEVAHFDWTEFGIMAGNSVGIALIGITVASLMYLQHKIDPAAIAEKYPSLYQFSLNKWYLDDLYHRVFVMGCRRLARQIMEVDYRVIDGAVNLTGLATIVSGEGLKYLESGRAQFYALIVFGAVLAFVIVFSVV